MTRGAPWQVPDPEMAAFCAQFATLLAADVKLMPALITSRQQTDNELLSEVLLDVQTELEAGLTLAAALSKQPDVFSPFAIQMVRQGEIEGTLPDAFRKLAEHHRGLEPERRASDGPVVLHLDAGVLMEAIRPFIVTVFLAIGVVGVLSAAVLVAKERNLIPDELEGPTILLVAALTLLLAAVVLRGTRRPKPAPAAPARVRTEPPPAEPVAAASPTPRPRTEEPRTAMRTDEDYLLRDPGTPVDLDVND